jgi:hypothetical protein
MLQGLAQKTVIPRGATTDQQYTNLVTGDGEREIFVIVFREGFTKPRGMLTV